MEEYDGRQFVGIDLHRRRSVIVRMTPEGERIGRPVRIDNDPFELAQQVASWGESPEVVLEATYGWYWAADVLADAGATVHLAHPLGVKGFAYRRVKNDERDAADLADLLRMGRLPEAWIAPPEVRGLREAVRHRCKLVALRSGLKAQVHAVLAKQGVRVPMSDLFGVGGHEAARRAAAGRAVTTPGCLASPAHRRVHVRDRHSGQAQQRPVEDPPRVPGDPGHPWGRAGAGGDLRGRDRRRDPLRPPRAAVLLGRHDPPAPRVRHQGPPRTDHQAGQPRWSAGPRSRPCKRLRDGPIGRARARIGERRGANIAKVAAARKLLTLVFYGLRDGHIRCLARPA